MDGFVCCCAYSCFFDAGVGTIGRIPFGHLGIFSSDITASGSRKGFPGVSHQTQVFRAENVFWAKDPHGVQ